MYSSQFCVICNSGYQTAGNDIWNEGALKCVSGSAYVPNCSALQFNNMGWGTRPTCYSCSKNFAQGSSWAQGCVGFTYDDNCRKAASTTTDDGCMTCYVAYYFSTSTCTLHAKLAAGVALLLVVLAWFN